MAPRKSKKMNGKKSIVLDTNIPVHDPNAFLKFHEHDLYIPAIVLEELDKLKTDRNETTAYNARQSTRFIEELFKQLDYDADIDQGVPLSVLSPVLLSGSDKTIAPTGMLYFQTEEVPPCAGVFKNNTHDNEILSFAFDLKNNKKKKNVVLVSNDINMRNKARILKIPYESYTSDQTIEDIQLLYSGTEILPPNFGEVLKTSLSWTHENQTYYEITAPFVKEWKLNQFLYSENLEEKDEFIVLKKEDDKAQIRTIINYREQDVFGIRALNREQNFALNALVDPSFDFVTLAGQAGTGKTALALAAALHLVIDKKSYNKIIFSRETFPLGEKHGFLPGSEEAKMAPWAGAVYDNIEMLTEKWEKLKGDPRTDEAMKKGKMANPEIDRALSLKSLNYMKGRSLLKKILIIDEAQDTTPKQVKELITRAGPGTKVIFLGNLAQGSSPYIPATSSGLAYVVDRASKTCPFSAHITLVGIKRSRLAEWAANNL